MNIIALYLKGRRYVIEDPAATLSRANQALATLERYKWRLDEVSRGLSVLEIEDLVTIREVCATLQRLEMVRHIASEIQAYLLELGTEGRLVALQLAELVAGVETDRELVVRDYLPPRRSGRKTRTPAAVVEALDVIGPTDLLELASVARALGYQGGADMLEDNVTPRGHRMLATVPRVPEVVRERLVEHYGSLQALLGASVEELQEVEGIGEHRARYIREGLARLAESSILERYN
jgi:diadenylate cyclase